MKPELQIVRSLQRLQCSACGTEANASCDCGKPYVPAAQRVAEYDKANPGQSTRQAAADLGISNKSVSVARGVTRVTPDTVTGRDGKTYPARKKPEVEDAPPSQDSEIADPAVIEDNALWFVARTNEHARVFRKLFRASTFDREQAHRIRTAIGQAIRKWQLAQAAIQIKDDPPEAP